MKPMLEKLPLGHFSFHIKQLNVPYLDYPWHYHDEYELTLIEEGEGTRFMGDHIERFGNGDLILVGPNLPHVWKNDSSYHHRNSKKKIKCTVIHFKYNSFGETFFQLPEAENIKRLLTKSTQAVRIKGDTRERLSVEILQLFKEKGISRILKLIQILEIISLSRETKLLSSPGFCNVYNESDSERLSAIYNYVLQHFREAISLPEIAEKVNMNASSFCRYFKLRTKKTFTQLINEIRIGQSCKMIIEKELSISEVCYQCGYNNLSYFNRQFKRIMGMTASQYIHQYKK